MTAKYCGNAGGPQRDSMERKEYPGAPGTGNREGRERDGANDLLGKILDRDNLNRAYKRVKRKTCLLQYFCRRCLGILGDALLCVMEAVAVLGA